MSSNQTTVNRAVHAEGPEKAFTQHEVEHGDIALKVIGDQRVELTPEDVRIYPILVQVLGDLLTAHRIFVFDAKPICISCLSL